MNLSAQLHSYRATAIPPGVPADEVELQSDHGTLPVFQVEASSAFRAATAAHHLTGHPILKVERIQAPDDGALPALTSFELTFAPGFTPSGVAHCATASRQVLAERLTTTVEALDSDSAIARFERTDNVMVTACKRVQIEEVAA